MTDAVIFPGQGSQSAGMQAELAASYDDVRACYAEASAVLGYDLWQLVQQGPAERLDATVVTQPAMLTAGVAAWRAFRTAGGRVPVMVAGHSLGEYTALVCAGALDFADAVGLVRSRGTLMQAAVAEGSGAMAAIIGLDDDQVIDACQRAGQGEVVSAVNFNSPGQVVIAGTRTAVERAVALASAAGARRAMMLNVSVPSHCALMRPATGKLAEALQAVDIRTPQLEVISNVDVRPYTDAASIRDGLARQLYSPVRWVETVRYLVAHGADRLIECGPGKVLSGLVRRIDKSVTLKFIESPESLVDAL
ncbi:MAG: ACP S-malonyltransferase [Woeseiaceae bacterium]|nr:ACP S-malonyltransferase [Woeseiaceae bacterium]